MGPACAWSSAVSSLPSAQEALPAMVWLASASAARMNRPAALVEGFSADSGIQFERAPPGRLFAPRSAASYSWIRPSDERLRCSS